MYLYEICIPIVTVHLVKAITRSYAPCVSVKKLWADLILLFIIANGGGSL